MRTNPGRKGSQALDDRRVWRSGIGETGRKSGKVPGLAAQAPAPSVSFTDSPTITLENSEFAALVGVLCGPNPQILGDHSEAHAGGFRGD